MARDCFKAAMLTVVHSGQSLFQAQKKLANLLRIEAGAQWISEYVQERVSRPLHLHTRELLVRNWPSHGKLEMR